MHASFLMPERLCMRYAAGCPHPAAYRIQNRLIRLNPCKGAAACAPVYIADTPEGCPYCILIAFENSVCY